MSRVSMTTLVECIVETVMSQEKNFDKGRHLVEERVGTKAAADKEQTRQENYQRSKSPVAVRVSDKFQSPLQLVRQYCDENTAGQGSEDRARQSQKNSLPERPHLLKEPVDPYLEKMKDKKRELAQDLKLIEADK